VGLSPFASSGCSCGKTSSQGEGRVVIIGPVQESRIAGQPNPQRFEIRYTWSIGQFTIADVIYPDARNYEGHKFLVYKATEAEVRDQKFLDPHFCESKKYLSPFARFEPTEEGWAAALALAKALTPSAWDRIQEDDEA